VYKSVIVGRIAPFDPEAAARRLYDLVEGLPSFFFVRNNSLFIGDLISTQALPQRVPLPADAASAT
jgi:hypothetical protein